MTDVRLPEGSQILLVDDEALILMVLEFAVVDAGAVPIPTPNLALALRALEDHAIDGAVLDMNLGAGDTCEPIARVLTGQEIPFILHSGDHVRLGEVIAAIDGPLVKKPAPGDVIVRALARLMAAVGRR